MAHEDSKLPSVSVRIVWTDPPDLIELETHVAADGWSGTARAYASPEQLREEAENLLRWCDHRNGAVAIEAGADTGIGGLTLRFCAIDMAGHIVCHIQLTTGDLPNDARPEQIWRLALEIPTEPSQIQRFAHQLVAIVSSLEGEAVLKGVPA